MSMTPVDTWAVDLAEVTFIYPWFGSEFVMAIVAIALWILWHIWQCKHESEEYRKEIDRFGNDENVQKGLNDH